MKKAILLGDNIIIAYFASLGLLILCFLSGLSLTSSGEIFFSTVLVVMSFFALVSIVQTKNKNLVIVGVFVQIFFLLMLLGPLNYTPFISFSSLIVMITLVVVMIRNDLSGLAVVAALIFAGIIAMLHLLVFVLSGFGSNTLLYSKISPDGRHKLVVTESDQGALGGSVGVHVERLFLLGLLKTQKRLYLGEWDCPEVKWVNNTKVEINNEQITIHSNKIIESDN